MAKITQEKQNSKAKWILFLTFKQIKTFKNLIYCLLVQNKMLTNN